MTFQSPIRASAAAMLAGLSLLLSGCLISPGKFTSQLELMEGNAFSYTYEGEIFFLGLSSLARMGAEAEAAEAAEADAGLEVTCFNEETYEERECTQAEIDEQQAESAMSAAQAAEQAQQLSAMMGGIDPTDPEAAEELREMLLRQKGWNKVEVLGDGLFNVSYSISGSLDHDFMFPLIEDFPTTNPFVQIFLRDEGIVRVNAPGFGPQNDDTSFMGGMTSGVAGMAGMAAMSDEPGDGAQFGSMPVIDGTFTIVTSGQILANNTDEGPTATANGQSLTWEVSPRTKSAPTALIDLSR